MTSTRWIQVESDWDTELTPVSGFGLAHIGAESLTGDPDPTQLISELALDDLRREAIRRDTRPPAGLCSEAELVEALVAAQLSIAQAGTPKR